MLDAEVMTVVVASPLTVREFAGGTPMPALVASRGDSYAPAVGTRVLVVRAEGRLYILGAA